jgi:RNA polymerase sigma factor (sigma-70 family)
MAGDPIATFLRQLRQLLGASQGGAGSDAHLLRRFLAQRDEEAFAALVHRHGPIVLGVCRRVLAEPCDVEDAFQATFLILVRKASSIARPELLGAWLYGVAHRVAVRARKQVVRRRAQEGQVVAVSIPDSTAALAWRELRPLLDAEVNRLPEKYRLPFILCHLEGKTNEEAARCLGCPKGTVLSRLARARERLRKRLTQRGITLTGATFAAVLTENTVSAAVPASLAAATSHNALQYLAGTAALPATVLAEGVMKAMLLTKVKSLLTLLLILGILGAGASVWTHQVLARKQPPAEIAGQPPGDMEPPAEKAVMPEKKDEAAAAPKQDDPAPLPSGAVARLGRLRFRHGESISNLAFSPDGAVLASAGNDTSAGYDLLQAAKEATDKTLCLWDVRTGKELARLPCNMGNLWSLAFSPDGTILAVAGASEQSVLILWDVAARKQLRQVRGPRHPSSIVPLPVAFAPNGKTFAFVGEDYVLRVWETATGKEVRRLRCKDQDQVCSLAFSPDGKWLAAGSWNGDVLQWRTDTGAALDSRHISRYLVRSLTFSADGKYLATLGESLQLWQTDTGKEFPYFEKPIQFPSAIAFSPAGATLAVAQPSGFSLWNVARGGGKFLSMDVATHSRAPSGVSCTSLVFSPDGKTLAAADRDGAIRLWDAASGQERFVSATPHALAFTRNGKTLLTGAEDGRVRFWDTATSKERRSFPTEGPVTFFALAHKEKILATAGADGVVTLWDAAGTKLHHIRQVDPRLEKIINPRKPIALDPVAALAFSVDDRTLAVVTSRTNSNTIGAWTEVLLGLWDTTTGKVIRLTNPLPPSGRGPWAGFRCAFSADGKTLAGWLDRQRFTVDVASSKAVRLSDEPASPSPHVKKAFRLEPEPRVVALSPDGKTLATGIWPQTGEGKLKKTSIIQLWEVGKRDLPEHPGFLTALAFSPDGKTLASATQHPQGPAATIRLWDVSSGAEVRHWDGHRGRVNALAFAPNGDSLASASADGTVLVWKIK